MTLNMFDEAKKDYIESLSQINVEELRKNIDKDKCVQLFHGTTTAYLNDILENGIMPRGLTKQHNWKENPSVDKIVYLSSKWHYFYSYQATEVYYKNKYGEEACENRPDLRWYSTWESFPCYIECLVPKALLVADEDFIYTTYMKQRILSSLNRNKPFSISWEECRDHFGTVGVFGGVPKEYLVSFTILGEPKLFNDFFLDSNSLYRKEFDKWQKGRGKGKIRLIDLIKREAESDQNGTWFLNQIPQEKEIGSIGLNPETKKLAITFY